MIIPSFSVLVIGVVVLVAALAVTWYLGSLTRSSKAEEHEGTGYKKAA